MRKVILTTFLLCLFFVVGVGFSALAQDDLTETYVAEDGSYAFQYPDGWEVDESESLVRLYSPRGYTPLILITYMGPNDLAQVTVDAADPVSALENTQAVINTITGDPVASVLGGRKAAVAAVTGDEIEGVAIMIEFSKGVYGMVFALTLPGDMVDATEMVFALAEGFGPAENIKPIQPSSKPSSIVRYDGEWEDVIAGLADAELVVSVGSLVFHENSAFFSGQGNFFTPLARTSPYSDIVMAGELSFSVGNAADTEICSLLSRIETDRRGTAVTYVDVGFLNDGSLVVQDYYAEGTRPNGTLVDLGLDLGSPHHLLIFLQDDLLTVYVDGELAVEDYKILDRAGTYGIALRGRGVGARCEGKNIWVYQTPTFTPGVCEASSPNTINKRSGPGTEFDRAGQLPAGTIMRVTGQAEGSDGFTWWQLEDDSWVRDDVAEIAGDCLNLPFVDS